MYNILKNFDLFFVDTNFIKKRYIDGYKVIFDKIDFSFAELKKNILKYGTWFPFYYLVNRVCSGKHRLFVLCCSNDCKRKFSVLKNNGKNKKLVLPLILPKSVVEQDDEVIDLFEINQIYFYSEQQRILKLNVKPNNILSNKQLGILYRNDIPENVLRLLIHTLGSLFSADIYKQYNESRLHIISKHPIINCNSYYKKYNKKILKQISLILIGKNE